MTDARATQDPALKDPDAAESSEGEVARARPAASADAPALRPSILDALFAPARALPGIGPKMAPLIEKLLGTPEREARVVDLLFHLPRAARGAEAHGLDQRRARRRAGDDRRHRGGASAGQIGSGRRPHRVLVEDATGDISLVFFGMPRARVEKMLPLGAHRYITGRIDLWDGTRQMVHPSRIVDEAGLAELPAVEPVYGATEGLTSRAINKLAVAALDRCRSCRNGRTRPGWRRTACRPSRMRSASSTAPRRGPRRPRIRSSRRPATPSRKRLAYDELLPRSSRSPSCAPASGERPAGSMPATAP